MEIITKPSRYYSPLRYPGGKAGLSKYLSVLLEVNSIHQCRYVEPFAGGAGAALNLLINEDVDSIVINDLDKHIYYFWYSIINNSEDFIERVEAVNLSVEEWVKQKQIFTDPNASIFEKGFATFFLNRTNRSGILNGGPIGGMEQRSEWKIDARFNREGLTERIHKIGLYKNRIHLENKNAFELLSNIDLKNNYFIYLDPPYVNKAKDLYLNHFTKDDHILLASFLNSSKHLKWVLSYDNDEFIKKLYKNRVCKEFNINYSADKVRKGKEIIIFSDNILQC
ncbi:MAG: DNA adenine methylase [Bacteroidales bacterium]|nr:DNA adenine methylase [Bacteroidales bacterium]